MMRIKRDYLNHPLKTMCRKYDGEIGLYNRSHCRRDSFKKEVFKKYNIILDNTVVVESDDKATGIYPYLVFFHTSLNSSAEKSIKCDCEITCERRAKDH